MRFTPMLASLADAPLADPDLVYEPKYDGIRAIAEVAPSGGVRLWSRLGNDKTRQFPEVAAALQRWAARLKAPIVLDGEIVALDANGEPAGFQRLQGRIHLAEGPQAPARVAFMLFDLLQEGSKDLRPRPLVERRAALERLFKRLARGRKANTPPVVRLSEQVAGDGRALYDRALASGWEGLIAKRASSIYQSGRRSPDWRKLKIVREQEFVVGGWTEPRGTRAHFGALLLGVYEGDDLVYAGHTGTGFDERELTRLMQRLKPLERRACPFRERPPSNERPHWVEPSLVVQVRFTEWTDDGRLRHPVYLGVRDDKEPKDVVREPEPGRRPARNARHSPPRTGSPAFRVPNAEPRTASPEPVSRNPEFGTPNLIDRLIEVERARADAVIELPGGSSFRVGNLHKVFWPALKLTKGDLLRYYCQAATFILPAVRDRPLVMKRFPNGIGGPPFYQHHLGLSARVPRGVRVELVGGPGHREERKPQFVGGTFATLLYMAQLAAISQDPWFSRVQSLDEVDYVALDLDPPAGVPFARVLDVARWIHDELEALGVPGFPKTSGAEGLHVYIPMPPGTPYEAGQLFCHIIATIVSQKHPKAATIERKVSARGPRVYVDFLQNAYGKTLATAYSARASEYAGVSTPLTWHEVHDGIRREDFTIRTAPARFKQIGDLWEGLRSSKGADLSRVSRYART